MKNSIFSKFCLMNLTIFILIIGIQIVGQALFFERYYLYTKEQLIEDEVDNFYTFLTDTQIDNRESIIEVMEYMQEVSRNTSIDLSIRREDMSKVIQIENYMKSNYLMLTDELTQNSYKVVVGDFLSGIQLKVNDKIEIKGVQDSFGYIIPNEIILNGIQIPIYGMNVALVTPLNEKDSERYAKLQHETPVQIMSRIEDPVIKKDEFRVINKKIEELPYYTKYNMVINASYTIVEQIGEDDKQYLISTQKIKDKYIVAINELNEVEEFMYTTDRFYLIIFILVLPMIVIVSLFYSRFITKPLIKMSHIANQISHSNFENKYDVKTKDEIGELGSALNAIGSNLKQTLKDLKDKMDLQHTQELKRRELIANISHELKTPLTLIQGNIEGFRKGIYSEDIFTDILEETGRMNDLIIEMLDVSRLEDPSFSLNKTFFDLYAVLLKQLDQLRALFNEKEILVQLKIDCCLEDEELIVSGDEKRMEEVIRNLLTNAIKYTPSGEKVVVSLKEYKGKYICIIENFGVTLSDAELINIWEPFYRKEKSRNRKYGGTGLGLCVVKRILELHKSNYAIKSTENSVIVYFEMEKIMV